MYDPHTCFTSIPNDILDLPKLKEFADDKFKVILNLNRLLPIVENIVEKGENAGNQHFLLFSTMFSKYFFLRVVKSWNCVVQR